jgi:deazaflavin-dependent oxidoreductase (nitroreductase family)
VHVVSSVRLRRWAIRGLSKAHLAVHRVTMGRVLGAVAGMPVLLLTTTGRRSGRARTTPLTFFRDGIDIVVIASNGGAGRPPDWSLNLQQTRRAVVRIGTDKLVVTARPASEQERERLWVVITAAYAGYARYQERTTRRIPVVLLTPEGPQVARHPRPSRRQRLGPRVVRQLAALRHGSDRRERAGSNAH